MEEYLEICAATLTTIAIIMSIMALYEVFKDTFKKK